MKKFFAILLTFLIIGTSVNAAIPLFRFFGGRKVAIPPAGQTVNFGVYTFPGFGGYSSISPPNTLSIVSETNASHSASTDFCLDPAFDIVPDGTGGAGNAIGGTCTGKYGSGTSKPTVANSPYTIVVRDISGNNATFTVNVINGRADTKSHYQFGTGNTGANPDSDAGTSFQIATTLLSTTLPAGTIVDVRDGSGSTFPTPALNPNDTVKYTITLPVTGWSQSSTRTVLQCENAKSGTDSDGNEIVGGYCTFGPLTFKNTSFGDHAIPLDIKHVSFTTYAIGNKDPFLTISSSGWGIGSYYNNFWENPVYVNKRIVRQYTINAMQLRGSVITHNHCDSVWVCVNDLEASNGEVATGVPFTPITYNVEVNQIGDFMDLTSYNYDIEYNFLYNQKPLLSNPFDGDSMVIGSRTYTYRTVATANTDVPLASNGEDSLFNLVCTINGGTYSVTLTNAITGGVTTTNCTSGINYVPGVLGVGAGVSAVFPSTNNPEAENPLITVTNNSGSSIAVSTSNVIFAQWHNGGVVSGTQITSIANGSSGSMVLQGAHVDTFQYTNETLNQAPLTTTMGCVAGGPCFPNSPSFGTIAHNIMLRGPGSDANKGGPQCVFWHDVGTASASIKSPIITNNICIGVLGNGILINQTDFPVIKYNTVIADPNSNAFSPGGYNWPFVNPAAYVQNNVQANIGVGNLGTGACQGNGGTWMNNITDVIKIQNQGGLGPTINALCATGSYITPTNINNVSLITGLTWNAANVTTAYRKAFGNFPATALVSDTNRAYVIQLMSPTAGVLTSSGGLENADGTYDGALFPMNNYGAVCWNDGNVFNPTTVCTPAQ